MRVAACLLLVTVCAQAQQADIEGVFGRAVQEQQRKDLPAAIRDYRKVLAMAPARADARVNLGAALSQAGQFDEAITEYRAALTALPDNSEVRKNLGLAYYKKGDLPHALTEFEAVRKRQPDDLQVAILMADSYVRSSKGADALKLLIPLDAANTGNPDFDYVMGTAMIASGRRRDGVARLEKMAAATQSVDAYFLAGSTLLDLNEGEAARKDLEVAVVMNPNLPHIFTLLGLARDRSGDPGEAAKAFRESVNRDPDDFEANLYLGAILTKQRNLDEAKGYLERALKLNPASTFARYENAIWHSTSGDYANAVGDLEKIVKEDPDWLEPHVELATVYYRLHRPEEGAKQREIVKDLTEKQQKRGPGK